MGNCVPGIRGGSKIDGDDDHDADDDNDRCDDNEGGVGIWEVGV